MNEKLIGRKQSEPYFEFLDLTLLYIWFVRIASTKIKCINTEYQICTSNFNIIIICKDFLICIMHLKSLRGYLLHGLIDNQF